MNSRLLAAIMMRYRYIAMLTIGVLVGQWLLYTALISDLLSFWCLLSAMLSDFNAVQQFSSLFLIHLVGIRPFVPVKNSIKSN